MFHRSTSQKYFLGLAAACLIASSAPVAGHANERDSDSIAVSARDLDLRTQEGAASLRHKVLAAAYKVCGEVNPGAAIGSDAFNDCVGEAMHRASRRVQTLIAAAQGPAMLASAAGPSR